jgi:integral membrane sensor domain MASE1
VSRRSVLSGSALLHPIGGEGMTVGLSGLLPKSPIAQRLLSVLLVFAGSYAGALAGTVAVFPGQGTAVLFPPYAVLAAALMLSPARYWWLCVLASMAGNFWPHLRHEGVTSFVLQAEVANVARGLIAAAGVRSFGEHIGRFNTIRDTVVFLGFAVIAAPITAAFIGAEGWGSAKPGG